MTDYNQGIIGIGMVTQVVSHSSPTMVGSRVLWISGEPVTAYHKPLFSLQWPAAKTDKKTEDVA